MITMPSKETVRRICILNKATYCYILVQNNLQVVKVLLDIPHDRSYSIKKELEEWCGVKFEIVTSESPSILVEEIQIKGEKILPIVT